MDKKELNALLSRYQRGKASADEMALLEKWYDELHAGEPEIEIVPAVLQEDYEIILDNIRREQESPAFKLLPKIALAASVIFGITLGLYYVKRSGQEQKSISTFATDIKPGGNKATLTLANGIQINLPDATSGAVAQQNGTNIFQKKAGELLYTNTTSFTSTASWNTVQTPKGGKYIVILPDGTKVWLNAASAISYPTTFARLQERRVKLEGEAYFEVAHNKAVPFRVETQKQTIEVLGTHFNVNAYPDEQSSKTTLLQGSISIDHSTILEPGQQATVGSNGIKITQVDTTDAVDWKNGDFIFSKGDDFKSAMRKVARWYNVSVVYDPDAPADKQLGGWVSQKNNLSVVLKKIESTGNVHFKLEGRRLIVTK